MSLHNQVFNLKNQINRLQLHISTLKNENEGLKQKLSVHELALKKKSANKKYSDVKFTKFSDSNSMDKIKRLMIENQKLKDEILSDFFKKKGVENGVKKIHKKVINQITKKLEKDKSVKMNKKLAEMNSNVKEKNKQIKELKNKLKKMDPEAYKKDQLENQKVKSKKKIFGKLFKSTAESANLDFGMANFKGMDIGKLDLKSSFKSDSNVSKAFQSGRDRLRELEQDKKYLEKKINKLENIKSIVTSSDLVNFVYNNSQKSVVVRGFLGLIIKSVERSEATRNEVKFLEELSGKYIHGKKNAFFGSPLSSSDLEYFPKFYGHWEEAEEDMYKMAIEKGDCDLFEYVKSHHDTMVFSERLELISKFLHGVNVLHSHGLIHGDIKPQNVLLLGKDVKLTDFENVQKKDEVTQEVNHGTYNYIDPQLFRASKNVKFSSQKIDKFALQREIYSCSCVIFFILYCHNPFANFLKFIFKEYTAMFGPNNLPSFLHYLVTLNRLDKMKEKSYNYKEIEKSFGKYEETFSKCYKYKSFFPLLFFDVKKEELRKSPYYIQIEKINKLLNRCMYFNENKRPNINYMIEIINECMLEVADKNFNESILVSKLDGKKSSKDIIKTWGPIEVRIFIDFCGCFYNFSNNFIAECKLKLSKFTGKKLLNLRQKSIENLFKGSSEIEKKMLLNAITTPFNYDHFVVYTKVTKLFQFKKIDKKMILSLSDADTMLKTYLHREGWEKQFQSFFKENKFIEKDSDDFEVKIASKGLKRGKKKNKQRIGIKLVITELGFDKTSRTARSFFSPFIHNIPALRKEFGLYHTALIFGPFYLSYNNSSLVIPREISSKSSILSLDMDIQGHFFAFKNNPYEKMMKKLSEILVKWNAKMTYKSVNLNKKSYCGNCQDFVEDVLKSMGLKVPSKEGPVGQWLKGLSEKGHGEMTFEPSQLFKDAFYLPKEISQLTFTTHKGLDDFVHKCVGVDELGLQMDFKEEYILLKAFDRAMWLRHLKTPNDERFKGNRCPFEDPRKTRSYITYEKDSDSDDSDSD